MDAIARSSMTTHKPLQKLIKAKLNEEDELGIKLLKAAYHIGKRELPKYEFRHHLEFASAVGADYSSLVSENAKVTYTSNRSVSELQSAISAVILEDKVSSINKSDVFSLVLDESTDNANKKRLMMYAQYLGDDGLDYALLSNKQVKMGSASAVNIVQLVLKDLKEKNIDTSKFVELISPPICFWTQKCYIGHSKKHFFKIQTAITLFLTDGVQCHLACIILLSIYVTSSAKISLVYADVNVGKSRD
ncbi:hypothetical protein DPMN_159370 [Dreissena polymorpha]|uniref:DUF4371 domain-containing protein n=1 Tax=Dreissena polymorpha TaxID=45954 RepID=A0A9D4EIZ7_DREPO|nr:hypothetical protein DPMN_159370 [Dreissena polymorpha]